MIYDELRPTRPTMVISRVHNLLIGPDPLSLT